MSKKLDTFTESEFLSFVEHVYFSKSPTERQHDNAVLEFETISEHPNGSDLLYYPDEGKSGPAAIVKEIKEWRAANGKPGFKSE